MINKKKVIIDFLPDSDRIRLSQQLERLKNVNNANYIKVNSKEEFFSEIELLHNNTEAFVLQIIAHGKEIGFGLNSNDFIYYRDLIDDFKKINKMTNNGLFLNLITVCSSIIQLSKFNNEEIKLFNTLIGCCKGAFVNSSILHSLSLYNSNIKDFKRELDNMNFNLDDNYSIEKPFTWSYVIK